MLPQIIWFRHSHENRNDLLRFGLMRLHFQGRVHYTELPFEKISAAGFGKKISELKDPRHVSFLLVKRGQNKLRILVDTEDSFALLTPLITEVDLCFCSGYNSDFFEKGQFVNSYSWQEDSDISDYRELLENKIKNLGGHFNKVKRFIPIAPNQGSSRELAPWMQRYRNLEDKWRNAVGQGTNFSDVYEGFERRETFLKSLRDLPLEYDIVVNDSLWGWPHHRINLHNKFLELHKAGHKVYSILNYVAPVKVDDVTYKNIRPDTFPMTTANTHEPYEVMVAKSRLAVYACGFHWGWRNIMMLALQTGIPVLTDRLLTEPYFDMTEFRIFQQEDHYWNSIETTLRSIDDQEWKNTKKHNQNVYDKYLSPEIVAQYFLSQTN